MESSSSDLFDQFLKTGMGAKPLIAGYENQLLEFAVEKPGYLGADQGGHCDNVSKAHRLVLPCVYRPG